jgi:hypothetical protein
LKIADPGGIEKKFLLSECASVFKYEKLPKNKCTFFEISRKTLLYFFYGLLVPLLGSLLVQQLCFL